MRAPISPPPRKAELTEPMASGPHFAERRRHGGGGLDGDLALVLDAQRPDGGADEVAGGSVLALGHLAVDPGSKRFREGYVAGVLGGHVRLLTHPTLGVFPSEPPGSKHLSAARAENP